MKRTATKASGPTPAPPSFWATKVVPHSRATSSSRASARVRFIEAGSALEGDSEKEDAGAGRRCHGPGSRDTIPICAAIGLPRAFRRRTGRAAQTATEEPRSPANAGIPAHEQSEPDRLRRGIGSRQLSMIAIGGAIGTGLFFASGSAIAQAGPGGALLAYALMGFAVYCMMQSLGEMATQLPIPGSFEAYAERFIDPSLGFAVGWNYWFSWSITLAAEFVAGALIVQFWFPHGNPTLWAMGFFVLLMALNLLSVKAYAEAEYWFAGIKVVTVDHLRGGRRPDDPGHAGRAAASASRTGSLHDAATGQHAPFVGGFTSIAAGVPGGRVFVPGHRGRGPGRRRDARSGQSVPKAIRTVFWRILLFYIGSIFVVGTLIPYTDPNLLRSDDGTSPIRRSRSSSSRFRASATTPPT